MIYDLNKAKFWFLNGLIIIFKRSFDVSVSLPAELLGL